MKNVAEINERNEEFLSKIIGEMTSDGVEAGVAPEGENIEEFDQPNFGDETAVILDILMSSGDMFSMSISHNDLEKLSKDEKYEEIKARLNIFHNMVPYVYTNDYQEAHEVEVTNFLNDMDVPVKYNHENNLLRFMFKLTDAISILSMIEGVIAEKKCGEHIMQQIFKIAEVSSKIMEGNTNENSETEDRNHQSIETGSITQNT